AAAGRDQAGADHDGREIGLADQPAPERFHQDSDIDRAAAEPAMLFRNRQRQPAELGKLFPYRCAETVRLRRRFAAVLGGAGLADKAVNAFAQQALLVAEGEVHLTVSPRWVCARKDASLTGPPPCRIPADYARDRADAAQRPARSRRAGP